MLIFTAVFGVWLLLLCFAYFVGTNKELQLANKELEFANKKLKEEVLTEQTEKYQMHTRLESILKYLDRDTEEFKSFETVLKQLPHDVKDGSRFYVNEPNCVRAAYQLLSGPDPLEVYFTKLYFDAYRIYFLNKEITGWLYQGKVIFFEKDFKEAQECYRSLSRSMNSF